MRGLALKITGVRNITVYNITVYNITVYKMTNLFPNSIHLISLPRFRNACTSAKQGATNVQVSPSSRCIRPRTSRQATGYYRHKRPNAQQVAGQQKHNGDPQPSAGRGSSRLLTITLFAVHYCGGYAPHHKTINEEDQA